MVKLDIQYAYRWYYKNGLWTKGYILDENGNYWTDSQLTLYLSNKSEKEILNIAKLYSGSFCIVKEYPNGGVFALVDKTRTFPLFWSLSKNGFMLSDNIESHEGYNNSQINRDSATEFYLLTYVSGQNTLYEGINSLQGAHYIKFFAKQVATSPYYIYIHGNFRSDIPKLIKELDTCHTKVIEKYINAAQGKRIVVPLSGGYDSTLIVRTLSELGYKNVMCFSYGSKYDTEAKTSYKNAKKYNYDWKFVEYTESKWKDLSNTSEYQKYMDYASKAISLPLLQDFLAIKELTDKKLLKLDDIIMPGHTGDFIESGHLPSWFLYRKTFNWRDLVVAIVNKHYNLWDYDKSKILKHLEIKLSNQLSKKNTYTGEEIANEYERWNWLERQCKYIVNSIRTYEFFGYKWFLPFWDQEMLNFWSQVPLEWRQGRRLYLKYEFNKNLSIEYPIVEAKKYMKQFINKYSLPLPCKHKNKTSAKKRFNDTYKISSILPSDYKIPDYDFAKSYLALITHHFLQKIVSEKYVKLIGNNLK